ncbi:hypothetical protein K493DRAFT_320329 [Basidiobolus meristosporus CBS 931.73]|uniref:Complex 1 LYR protein domain-containing protein n=1 Tax=Basidiobolus meristosporus CBS 931.73 TaxID=1314790 RepID=A0A1Y1XBA9_9FUNG|nr:hypothetical protein K493DRAFT_320329 [Basidiobolus meristosporus CBS 931.73]|eukprot:ORX83007.1 hypothetical protein K493DRAFT_320329 [Basidiobolus meristosporus CBS 931.73]
MLLRRLHSTLSAASAQHQPPVKRSGLQQDVINFYRDCFRAIRSKPQQNRPHFQQYIRSEFRKHDLTKRDFATIEYLLRVGKRKLEQMSSGSVKDIHLT